MVRKMVLAVAGSAPSRRISIGSAVPVNVPMVREQIIEIAITTPSFQVPLPE